MKNKISLTKLYFIFLYVGAILLGGGYVILPILTAELCNKRNILKETELIDFYTLSQSLPGIVAANISMFIGYKLKGKTGAIVSMLGVITIPFLCIILLASILETFVNNRYVEGVFWGIGIAVIALIILTVREMWLKTNRNLFFYLIFLASLISLVIFKLSPVNVIIIYCIIGIIVKVIGRRRYE